ncbi:helix-turn-helix transcriptional regulator [Larkinella arboricola]
MQIMEMQWDTAEDIELHDVNPSEGVSINFMLSGAMDTQFRGIRPALNMRPGTHNLVHAPDATHLSRLKRGQSMSMLLVSLEKAFFASAIGSSDRWSERVLTDFDHRRPFSGVPGTSTITPRMQHLIHDIRDGKAMGPMRNLLIQSRVLELVALEIEQFRTPVPGAETMPVDEVEKLHQLKRYLEANFLAEHSLAQLSRYCLLNEFKVKKGFRQLFNTTVFNYLRKLRMDHAGQLLRHGPLSVDEVADRLGYEHSQHFSIAFKKYTGVTPSQYQHGKPSVYA